MDYSRPGSSVHGIFQARVLEWAAIFLQWYLLIFYFLIILEGQWTKLDFIPIFSSNVFFCTRIQPKVPCLYLVVIILVSSNLWQPHFFLVFQWPNTFESTGQVLCRMSPNLGSPEVFFMIRPGLGFGGRTLQRWSTLLLKLRGYT